jgi:SAM-dependent methyltransferase
LLRAGIRPRETLAHIANSPKRQRRLEVAPQVTCRTRAVALPTTPPVYSPIVTQLAEAYGAPVCRSLGTDPAWFARELLEERRAEEVLELIERNIPFPLRGKRVLEVGSGLGVIQLLARKKGIIVSGVEPERLGARTATELFSEHGAGVAPVACAVGERLPFPDSSFDVVYSSQVLEHVQNPDRVISETVRVLKPGGAFIHIFPNYGSFWEGHYGLPWIPHLPKFLGRFYLRLWSRNPAFLDELQLVTHQGISRSVSRHRGIRVVNWGVSLWEHRVRTADFSEWAYLARVKRAVHLLHRLHLVTLLVAIGKLLKFETPIVLVGIKDVT